MPPGPEIPLQARVSRSSPLHLGAALALALAAVAMPAAR